MTLLEEFREARKELLEALDGLQPTDVWSEEGWTVHDLIGHIAAWEREVLAALQESQVGRTTYELASYHNDDHWNAMMRARKADLAPEQVRTDFFMIHYELEALLHELATSEEALAAPIHVTWAGQTTVADLVRRTSIEHSREHAEQLRAWRARRDVS